MVFRFLLLFLIASSALAADVAGVKIPDEDQKLLLNGAGLRKRAFFQVYVLALYLPEKKTAAADVIGMPGPKRILIHMMRDVDAGQFSDALRDGLAANLGEAEFKAATPSMARLADMMDTIKEAKSGMRFTLDWVPGSGTVLSANGKPLGPAIAGEDFYRALLRIWLGDKPVQSDLKPALLGGRQ
jgi:hypothetical protein